MIHRKRSNSGPSKYTQGSKEHDRLTQYNIDREEPVNVQWEMPCEIPLISMDHTSTNHTVIQTADRLPLRITYNPEHEFQQSEQPF